MNWEISNIFWDLKIEKILQLSFSYCYSKTRRRGDKGDGSGGDGEEQKLYLQEPLLECRVPPEPDLTFLTDLPGGLDYNEWLASHSKLNTAFFIDIAR